MKTKDNIKQLIDGNLKERYRIIAPVRENNSIFYKEIQSFNEITFDYILPDKSIKEYFLPITENLFSYDLEKDNILLKDGKISDRETIIFGVRPCDAASLPILDKIFNWDYTDHTYINRRNSTTIISIACSRCDRYCRCSSLGLAPNAKEGSDILLTETDSNEYIVEVLTPKGKEIIHDEVEKSSASPKVADLKKKTFSLQKIKPWLDNNFENEVWQDLTRRCLGCGVCTYICPTCHCFDIVDESCLSFGNRVKNWDSCQFANFTVHTSGHNPRPSQDKRHRQRIMHKFSYYPERFGLTLCSGCGRCARQCPVKLGVCEIIGNLAGKENSQ